MRQPAQYVATVRRWPKEFHHGSLSQASYVAKMYTKMTGHKIVVTASIRPKTFAFWEIIPRPRHEAFYE